VILNTKALCGQMASRQGNAVCIQIPILIKPTAAIEQYSVRAGCVGAHHWGPAKLQHFGRHNKERAICHLCMLHTIGARPGIRRGSNTAG
jgi:hypothetical protein